jgi:hypothetical protein
MKIPTTILALGTGFLLAAGPSSAQDTRAQEAAKVIDAEVNLMRRDLRDQKKQIVAANLPLSGDEAAKFWPQYDAYAQETTKLNDRRYALVKEYAASYSAMTDTQAGSLMRRWIGADEEATKLRQSWIPKFEQLLGAKKTAMFFQIDRRLALMIELQISAELPLVQP